MNKRWHDKHKMPMNAPDAQKIKWHIKHQKQCACRPIPKTLRDVMTPDQLAQATPKD